MRLSLRWMDIEEGFGWAQLSFSGVPYSALKGLRAESQMPPQDPALPPAHAPEPSPGDISRLTKLINSTPLPSLDNLLRQELLPLLNSSSSSSSSSLLIPHLLSRLLSAHSSSLKTLRLFLFSLLHCSPPHPLSFHSTLSSLSRSRLFPHTLRLFSHISSSGSGHHPSLLTPHSLSIPLSRLSSLGHPLPLILSFFRSADLIFSRGGAPFDSSHLNTLLRSLCSRGRVGDARHAFTLLHSRFPPDTATLNTLLVGFKNSRHLLALRLFLHDALLRGFRPDLVTHNILLDAYCKLNRFPLALRHLHQMETEGFSPTVRTLTTLIHGAGIARDLPRARQMFDEILSRDLEPDRGAYNALMGAVVRSGDLQGGTAIMDEMEEKGVGVDDVGYYTMMCGMKKRGDLEGFCGVYKRMVSKGYVPRVRTVMLLMKYFCECRRVELGLELWDYLVDNGCCPHRHALDLLVTGLCSGGGIVEDAFRCFKQLVERERWPSERSFKMLEAALMRSSENEKVGELRMMIQGLESLGLPSPSTDFDGEEDEFML